MLPLWKFAYEKTRKMNVTDMCFNTLYYDLFAVCYGSRELIQHIKNLLICRLFEFLSIYFYFDQKFIQFYIAVDFLKQGPEGAVCLFTVKNPSYPDYISK